MPKRILTTAEAINEGIKISMEKDKKLLCYGLGATDPKGIFGTTIGLEKKFGKNRIFDVPASENTLTGIAIGCAMNGTRAIFTSQRSDFILLAMDQLINGAAKWRYMFGANHSVPITIRLIVGKGWGQGPTHSQNFHSWFANVPGLKVVMPTSPNDHKGLLISSIFDNNPVIFIEQRWLHNNKGYVRDSFFKIKIGEPNIIKKGKDLTIVSMSYLTLEALKASEYLKNIGIDCEIINLNSIKPLNYKKIFDSVKKTKKILVLDTSHEICSFGSEIISKVSSELFSKLNYRPMKMTFPDVPSPSSQALHKYFYFDYSDIYKFVGKKMFNKKLEVIKEDVSFKDTPPKEKFFGPF